MAPFVITEGAVLGDRRYRLERRLGSGGMASVWLARDERLERPVAVKVISDSLAADARYRERFAREARAAAAVSHPGIVPVYDYGLQGERPFLVMEYVPGEMLAQLIAAGARGAIDPVAVARQLLDALQCIHDASLVHRDVKPANVLVGGVGRVRLTDFGIAQLLDAAPLTQTGMVLGTLRYLAPEVIAGSRSGPAADLYATGVLLRELVEVEPAPALTALITALTAADPTARPVSAATASRLAPASGQQPRPPAAGQRAGAAPTVAMRAATSGATRPMTRSTRVLPRRPASGPLGRPPLGAVAAVVAAAIAVVVVIVALGSSGGAGGSQSASATTAAPAPASADLSTQLRALNRIVDASARR